MSFVSMLCYLDTSDMRDENGITCKPDKTEVLY